ncbi:hypothetical protein HMPREF0373_02682 [Eubacterium ramulus ATCC 29099]|uniref:Uncharacterized protein n=1 Tax=Eubacterium ramulus ATCC 29099 TaxID=1256908 RepID=U2NY10_EUBRA|nr:hypothetical protein HMPREF0373_02682 [Eubacterium ramulus ATCC 29099]
MRESGQRKLTYSSQKHCTLYLYQKLLLEKFKSVSQWIWT